MTIHDESLRHRADEDADALTEAEARLPRLQDDHALEGAHVAQLRGVVQDRAALIVPPGHAPDPATPGRPWDRPRRGPARARLP